MKTIQLHQQSDIEKYLIFPKWFRPIVRRFCWKHKWQTFQLDNQIATGCLCCGLNYSLYRQNKQ